MLHLITYDIVSSSTNNDDVIETIKKAFPEYFHVQKSVWIVSSSKTSMEVFDAIKKAFHNGDRIFVCEEDNWVANRCLDAGGLDKLREME